MVKISDYLDANLVCFLDVTTRDDALNAMVDRVYLTGRLENRQTFYDAIISREEIVTTGIGMGVAIPHAKLPSYNQFFIAVAVLKKGVDWQALDGAPVRLIFMIGGPDNKQTEYLQILSGLTSVLRDEERRKKILVADNPQAILDLLTKR